MAAEPARHQGRFDADTDPTGRAAGIAAIARHADPADPTSVSQPRSDRARANAGLGHTPTARAHYMAFGGRMSWHEILVAACGQEQPSIRWSKRR